MPSFGSGGVLWTLAIEWHIYLFAGGLFHLFVGKKKLLPLVFAITFLPVPLTFFNQNVPLKIGGGLSYLWFLGYFIYYFVREVNLKELSYELLSLLLLGALLLLSWTIKPKSEYELVDYPILAFIFLVLLCISQKSKFSYKYPKAYFLNKRLADFSFTLYLLHYSIFLLILKSFGGESKKIALFSFIIVNLFSYFIAYFTEMKHKSLRNKLQNTLLN